MLELKRIYKVYKVNEIEQVALDNICINFRKNEFVSILGPSGSGKSTLLNIIGGLDHYTSGDLIINGVSTKQYKPRDWDSYRNHKIGFVFQNYNLINHQSILSNVELALTLSGVSSLERKRRAKELLNKVGLSAHINKKPTQLSGGQMQRVAIARALVNNPDIILADEPTGALDSNTSIQIMDLLKEVAKEKLVIMVTHNPDLAKKYSTRIVSLKDGKIIDDTNPFKGKEENVVSEEKKKKSSMSFLTAISLSKNNLKTKRGRTILTGIAGSIGIIGIALVLGLSNGVRNYISDMQMESSNSQAIRVQSTIIDDSNSDYEIIIDEEKKAEVNKILAVDDVSINSMVRTTKNTKKNNLKKLKQYIDENKSELEKMASNIRYDYNVELNIYDNENEKITKVNPLGEGSALATGLFDSLLSGNSILNNSFAQVLSENNYEVLSGKMPTNYNELVLITNQDGIVNLSTIYSLGLKDREDITKIMEQATKGEKISIGDVSFDYDKIIGKKYKLVMATDFYELVNGSWISKENDTKYINSLVNAGTDLEIVGIVKVKDKNIASSYLGYTTDLTKYVVEKANQTDIVNRQKENSTIDVFTGLAFDGINSTYENNLKILGAGNLDEPYLINIYPKDYEAKNQLKEFIGKYNENAPQEDKIIYVDEMEALTSAVTTMVKLISGVLIALVSISLVVSGIMIGIITYISVMERTKEIGILRAIGASKKDIKRVFCAETIIEGLASGIFGILTAYLASFMTNTIITLIAKIEKIILITPVHAIILIGISVGLTMLAGLKPATIASKKDPVEALRTE